MQRAAALLAAAWAAPTDKRIEPGKFPTHCKCGAISIRRSPPQFNQSQTVSQQSASDPQLASLGFINHRPTGEPCEETVSLEMAMTATSTRSTRRAEGLVAHPAQAHPQAPPQAQAQSQSQRATRHHQHLQQSNSSRPLKRLHEATNLAYDLKPPKKTKFEIEIPSKSQYQARLYPENIDSRHQHHRPARVASVTATHNKPPKHDARQAATTAPPPAAPEPTQAAAPRPAPPPAKTATTATTAQDKAASSPASSVAAHTKHREKVVNGIKHELDRLQPSSADMATNSQGRKLRSQEGVRYKSELSAYFPEYDEVIGNIPKEQRKLFLFFCVSVFAGLSYTFFGSYSRSIALNLGRYS